LQEKVNQRTLICHVEHVTSYFMKKEHVGIYF